MSNNSSKLLNLFNRHGIEYIAHSIVGEAKAIVEFTGNYQGRPVIWKATLIACLNPGYTGKCKSSRQFIDISDENNGNLTVEIGLSVTVIDEPSILKTIIMMRQYKKLKLGSHEFDGMTK